MEKYHRVKRYFKQSRGTANDPYENVVHMTISKANDPQRTYAEFPPSVEDWSAAIRSADFKEVHKWITKCPQLVRSVVDNYFQRTAIHLACEYDNLEILTLLLETDKRLSGEEERTPTLDASPYNKRDKYGDTPVFYAKSSAIVLQMLELDELLVTGNHGKPLLWWCEFRGILTEAIASHQKLREQLGVRWDGKLPIELALDGGYIETCILMTKALKNTSLKARNIHLRALLMVASFNPKYVMRIANATIDLNLGPLHLELALELGNIDVCTKMVKSLDKETPDVKGIYLRTMINSQALLYRELINNILRETGGSILGWLGERDSELGKEERLRIMAVIMRVQQKVGWFEPENEDHKKLLWTFCCDANLEMVNFMLSMPGMHDPEMEDGTTAFAMALAQRDVALIRAMLNQKQFSSLQFLHLAKDAVKELESRPDNCTEMETMLVDAIQELDISAMETSSSGITYCQHIREINERYPYSNQMTEHIWPFNKRSHQAISRRIKLAYKTKEMENFILQDVCINVNKNTLPDPRPCHHESENRMNCMISQSLLAICQSLEEDFQNGPLSALQPYFELVGSMAERTRVGLANELDIGLHFKLWKEHIPFMVEDDPFSLKKADSCPAEMDKFFDGKLFKFHSFMAFLLNITEKAVTGIFDQKKNPPNLKRLTTNQNWSDGETPCKGECKEKTEIRKFVQCSQCAIAVSQTKIGIVLQFEYSWSCDDREIKKIYCSIDLIPAFTIMPIHVLQLAKIISRAMLASDHPEGWLNFLFKYFSDYRIIQELLLCGKDHVLCVSLKTMNFYEGRNHHIRPAQVFTEDKFQSDRLRVIYSHIKVLKKVLGLDLSSFWVKKELLKNQYQSTVDSCDDDDTALVQVLSHPEFRSKLVSSKIDFHESNKKGCIFLRMLCRAIEPSRSNSRDQLKFEKGDMILITEETSIPYADKMGMVMCMMGCLDEDRSKRALVPIKKVEFLQDHMLYGPGFCDSLSRMKV